MDTLLTTLQSHQNACLREHKDRLLRAAAISATTSWPVCSIPSMSSIVLVLRQIKQVVHDSTLTDAEKIGQVRHMLPADNDNEPAAVIAMRKELDAGRGDADFHDVLESRSLKLQNRIAPIIRSLVFQGEPAAAGLLAAIQHFKAKDGAVGRSAPHDFLEPAERAAVMRDGQVVRISLYKAFLFTHIARALKAGTLNLEHSYKYRPLDDYLIGKERWQREKDVLLARAGLQDSHRSPPGLAELDEALHQQYLATNGHAAAGANPYLKATAERPVQDRHAEAGRRARRNRSSRSFRNGTTCRWQRSWRRSTAMPSSPTSCSTGNSASRNKSARRPFMPGSWAWAVASAPEGWRGSPKASAKPNSSMR